jgi:hypothetical protein
MDKESQKIQKNTNWWMRSRAIGTQIDAILAKGRQSQTRSNSGAENHGSLGDRRVAEAEGILRARGLN